MQDQEEQGLMVTAKPTVTSSPLLRIRTLQRARTRYRKPRRRRHLPARRWSMRRGPRGATSRKRTQRTRRRTKVKPDAEVVAVTKEEKEEKETLVEDPEEEEETDEVKLQSRRLSICPKAFVEWEAVSLHVLQQCFLAIADNHQDLRLPCMTGGRSRRHCQVTRRRRAKLVPCSLAAGHACRD